MTKLLSEIVELTQRNLKLRDALLSVKWDIQRISDYDSDHIIAIQLGDMADEIIENIDKALEDTKYIQYAFIASVR